MKFFPLKSSDWIDIAALVVSTITAFINYARFRREKEESARS